MPPYTVEDHGAAAVIGDATGFLNAAMLFLGSCGVDVSPHELDHICFRTHSTEEYLAVCDALVKDHGKVLVEGMIGGRPITTIELHTPLVLKRSDGHTWPIRCVEVPAPKPGQSLVIYA